MFSAQHHKRRAPSTRLYWPMRHYVIRRNFSIDNKYTIYENGHVAYNVRGGVLFAGIDNLTIEDKFGTPLVRIEQELGHFLHPTFELVSADGQRLARIRKPFFGYNYEIDTVYGPYRLFVISRESGYYSIWNARNQMIAQRSSIIEVAGNEDQAFLLALIIVFNNYVKPHPPPSSYGR